MQGPPRQGPPRQGPIHDSQTGVLDRPPTQQASRQGLPGASQAGLPGSQARASQAGPPGRGLPDRGWRQHPQAGASHAEPRPPRQGPPRQASQLPGKGLPRLPGRGLPGRASHPRQGPPRQGPPRQGLPGPARQGPPARAGGCDVLPEGLGYLILGRPDGFLVSDLPGPPRSPQLPAGLELRRPPEGFWLRSGLACRLRRVRPARRPRAHSV